MSTRKRTAPVWIGTTLVVLGAALVVARAMRRDGPATTAAGTGLVTTLEVKQFTVGEPAPRHWAPVVFAESLASRLSRMPGLGVHTAAAGGGRSDYSLQGNVGARDGRLVIAVRLHETDERQPIWTATFWRNDEPGAKLVEDLASDVAEALYGHLARRTVSELRERR